MSTENGRLQDILPKSEEGFSGGQTEKHHEIEWNAVVLNKKLPEIKYGME